MLISYTYTAQTWKGARINNLHMPEPEQIFPEALSDATG